jgi:hypothetical protein
MPAMPGDGQHNGKDAYEASIEHASKQVSKSRLAAAIAQIIREHEKQ